MRKHRLARFAAVLIFCAALFCCVLALAAAVWAFRGGPDGWGPGWRGWVLIPVLAGGCFGAVGLLIFGAVVYFLTRIERNLTSAARQRETATAKPVAVPSVAAPVIAAGATATAAAEEQLAEAAPLIAPVAAAVELPEPLVEAVVQAPEIVPPAVVAELPQLTVEATPADVPATLPEFAVEVGPVVEVVAPAISAPAPEVYFPSVEIFEPELEAGAPTSEATLPEIELPTVEVAEPEVEAPLAEVRRVPAIEIAEPQVEAPLAVMRRAPAIEIAEPQVEAPLAVMRRAPAIEIAAADDVTALRAQLAALQAKLAELETPPAAMVQVSEAPDRLAAELPVTLPVAPEVENLPAAAVGRLPGAVEAARIAAEMAALKPAPRHEPVSPTPLAAETKPPSAGAPADDLLVIQGIGPTYARRLAEVGITTFAALAAASDELLDQITIGLPGRATRENWRGQARQLAG